MSFQNTFSGGELFDVSHVSKQSGALIELIVEINIESISRIETDGNVVKKAIEMKSFSP